MIHRSLFFAFTAFLLVNLAACQPPPETSMATARITLVAVSGAACDHAGTLAVDNLNVPTALLVCAPPKTSAHAGPASVWKVASTVRAQETPGAPCARAGQLGRDETGKIMICIDGGSPRAGGE